MISTRVMDIKLREAAEGLGEDSTGKALTPRLWKSLRWVAEHGEGLMEPGLCVESGSSVHSVFRHPKFSHTDWRAHPDYWRPDYQGSAQSIFASLSITGDFKVIFLIPWGNMVPCLVDLKAKQEWCNAIIYLLRTSKGSVRGWAKNKMACSFKRNNFIKREPLIPPFYGFYSTSGDLYYTFYRAKF